MRSTIILALVPLAGLVTAGPCPFKEMRESMGGALSKRDAETAAKLARNPDWIPAMDLKNSPHEKREAEPEAAPQGLGGLGGGLGGILGNPLGGGLLNGVLQPLSGILADLDIPTPQEFGLAPINGDLPGHEFIAPGPTDIRGLCPTLNTLANHGFLSRDGITTFAEASNAVQTAYGFAYDLSTGLSALGLIAGGDLVTGKYSIGGADSRVPNTLGPALGLDKHGTFEIDGSITREDNYFGNQANFQLDRWNALNDKANDIGGGFGRSLFVAEKKTTYDTARASNPYFNAGLKYFVVAHAERAFVFRGLPNGTDPDNPNFANISPFFLDERFPEDWFRRATPYTAANAVTDVLDLYSGSPVALGANEGLNNFVPTGLDIPMSPQALACFLLENIFDTIPGQVQPTLLSNLETYQGFVDGIMTPLVGQAFGGCPGLKNYTVPSASAGTTSDGSQGASGSPVDGVYP